MTDLHVCPNNVAWSSPFRLVAASTVFLPTNVLFNERCWYEALVIYRIHGKSTATQSCCFPTTQTAIKRRQIMTILLDFENHRWSREFSCHRLFQKPIHQFNACFILLKINGHRKDRKMHPSGRLTTSQCKFKTTMSTCDRTARRVHKDADASLAIGRFVCLCTRWPQSCLRHTKWTPECSLIIGLRINEISHGLNSWKKETRLCKVLRKINDKKCLWKSHAQTDDCLHAGTSNPFTQALRPFSMNKHLLVVGK